MKKTTLALILLTGCLQTSYAQTDVVTNKEKTADQYVSVQITGLIRQVFNFNNSNTSTNVNPYLLTYNINNKKTGWGLRAGIGYNYQSTSTDDGITVATTKLNDLQFRAGVEKAFRLSEKWSAGAGIDAVFNMNDDHTTSTIHSSDTVTTDTKSKSMGYGGGAMGWLRYSITPKILVGTEASFYYVSTSQDNTVTETDRSFDPFGSGNSIITTEQTKSKPKTAQGTFNSPIVFYLTVKF